MSYVFISHVEEDQSIATEIAQGLEAAGFKAWYYERDSVPGPSYLSQILAAIRESAAVIVIISRDALGSWQVDKEVIQVHESGIPFIPLLKDLSHAEFRSRNPEWAMAMGAATSTVIPPAGVGPVIPRIVAGLTLVGLPIASTVAAPPTHVQTVSQYTESQSARTTVDPHYVHTVPGAVPSYPEAQMMPESAPVHVVQPATAPPPTREESVVQSVRRWELRHSLWMLWLITLGCLNGIAFLWIGYRVRNWQWGVYGCLYLVPFVLLFPLAPSGGQSNGLAFNIALLLVIVVAVVSSIHAFRVRPSYLLRLQALHPIAGQSAILSQIPGQDGVSQAPLSPPNDSIQPFLLAGGLGLVAIVVLGIVANKIFNPSSGPTVPTPVAFPTPTGMILLQDSLANPATGKLEKFSGAPRDTFKGYQNGHYDIKIINPKFNLIATEYLDAVGVQSDTAMIVDARVVPPLSGRAVDVACRSTTTGGKNTSYRLYLHPDTGTYKIARFAVSRDNTLIGPAPLSAINRGSAWNHIELTCQGNRISASINGVAIPTQIDSGLDSLQRGKLWMGVETDPGPDVGEAQFKNLVVYQK